MQEPPVNLPRRSDEGMFPAAVFHCDERSIYICNSYGRGHAFIAWTFAGSLISIPFLRFFIDGNWGFIFGIRSGGDWLMLALHLLCIVMCIFAGPRWSKIHIDLVAQCVEEERRSGPLRKRKSARLDSFDRVVVKNAIESGVEVTLNGTNCWCVVWGRDVKETFRIASELSARLQLPFVEGR